MTTTPTASASRSNVFFMLLSAGIFLFFGFGTSWNYTGVNGQFLLFVALLDWTLKLTGIAFGASALVTLANGFLGNLLYSAFGLGSAIMFVIVGIMDIMDTQHTAMSPLLLFIFAAWNGYGSWSGLQEVLTASAARSPDDVHSRSQGAPPGIQP